MNLTFLFTMFYSASLGWVVGNARLLGAPHAIALSLFCCIGIAFTLKFAIDFHLMAYWNRQSLKNLRGGL